MAMSNTVHISIHSICDAEVEAEYSRRAFLVFLNTYCGAWSGECVTIRYPAKMTNSVAEHSPQINVEDVIATHFTNPTSENF